MQTDLRPPCPKTTMLSICSITVALQSSCTTFNQASFALQLYHCAITVANLAWWQLFFHQDVIRRRQCCVIRTRCRYLNMAATTGETTMSDLLQFADCGLRDKQVTQCLGYFAPSYYLGSNRQKLSTSVVPVPDFTKKVVHKISFIHRFIMWPIATLTCTENVLCRQPNGILPVLCTYTPSKKSFGKLLYFILFCFFLSCCCADDYMHPASCDR